MTPQELLPYLKDSFKAMEFTVQLSKDKDWLRVSTDSNFFIVCVSQESKDHVSISFPRNGIRALIFVTGVPGYVSMSKILQVCMDALKLKKVIY
jgi:hypothetical protein